MALAWISAVAATIAAAGAGFQLWFRRPKIKIEWLRADDGGDGNDPWVFVWLHVRNVGDAPVKSVTIRPLLNGGSADYALARPLRIDHERAPDGRSAAIPPNDYASVGIAFKQEHALLDTPDGLVRFPGGEVLSVEVTARGFVKIVSTYSPTSSGW